mmetsp:Transcript_13843/g.23520  ORF Transcript_13843/g.23520 Transcript_13843/m.23520 type:complete len:230 (-) Transcript_13843:119-808(-)
MIYKYLFLALATAAAATATAASGEDHKSFNLRAATDDGHQHNNKNLRGVISLASNEEDYDGPTHGTTTENSSTTTSIGNTSRSSSGGPFSNACLHGRFSYSNLIEDVASISVGVFDGNGAITEMDNIEINQPNPATGGRLEVSLPFNYGSYEVYANGRGVIYLSVGGPNSPYSNPPAMAEFVVTGTSGNGCEITAVDSFLSASSKDGNGNDVGVGNQLVAPRFKKIADF